jgi:hypothetical protein
MFDNIGFWSLVLNGLVLIVSVSGFVKIMRNDLFHLEKDTKEIKNLLSTVDKKLDDTSERLAKIEGKCLANHG